MSGNNIKDIFTKGGVNVVAILPLRAKVSVVIWLLGASLDTWIFIGLHFIYIIFYVHRHILFKKEISVYPENLLDNTERNSQNQRTILMIQERWKYYIYFFGTFNFSLLWKLFCTIFILQLVIQLSNAADAFTALAIFTGHKDAGEIFLNFSQVIKKFGDFPW